MKKSTATTSISAQHSRRVIQLDESQMAIYNTGRIDILNPAGEPIDCVGHITTQLNKFGSAEEVANSLCLIEELLLGNTEGATLSPHAIAGLSDVLSRAQGLLES